MNGPGGGTNPPEPGDRRGPGSHNMPNSSAPQQPAMGLHRPETKPNPDATLPTQATPDGHGAHSTPDGQRGVTGSPVAQNISAPTTLTSSGGASSQQHVSRYMASGPGNHNYSFFDNASANFSIDNYGHQQYHHPHMSAAPPAFSNARNYGHQQYSQMPAASAHQPDVRPYYANCTPTPEKQQKPEFLLPTERVTETSSSHAPSMMDPSVGFEDFFPSPLELPFNFDNDFIVNVEHGEERAQGLIDWNNSGADDTTSGNPNATQLSSAEIRRFLAGLGAEDTTSGNLNDNQHSNAEIPSHAVGTSANGTTSDNIAADTSGYVATKSGKRLKTGHGPTLQQIPNQPAENDQMPKQERRSSSASINIKPMAKQRPRKRGRNKSGAQKPAGGAIFDLSDNEAEDIPFETALANTTLFVELKFAPKGDDVDRVKADRMLWINAIARAFRKPYAKTPAFHDFGDIQAEFEPWQEGEWQRAKADAADSRYPNRLDSCATVLFHKIIQSHENCGLKACTASFALDPTLCCSKRLLAIIAAIEHSAVIRFDFINSQRINELIGNPVGALKTKEANKLTNEKKKPEYKYLVKKDVGQTGRAPRVKKTTNDAEKLVSLSDVSSELSDYTSTSPPHSGSDELRLAYEFEGQMQEDMTKFFTGKYGSADPALKDILENSQSQKATLPQ